jgi:hypothetical protein
MKQNYFKISGKELKVLHLESVRTGLYQIAMGGLIILIAMIFLNIIACIVNKTSLNTILQLFKDVVLIIVCILIPLAALILARRFPPAPVVTFHSDTQTVKWRCQSLRLEVPFTGIVFTQTRMPSKSGISNVFVLVTAVGDKPFFPGDQRSANPAIPYAKDLCFYKAGTQEEADESIEIIRMFMSDKWEAYAGPSKFDDL